MPYGFIEVVPESLHEAFEGDGWFTPVEPPAKRRRIDVEGSSGSILQDSDSRAAVLQDYFTATKFTIQLVCVTG